jgi:hypothetical protein
VYVLARGAGSGESNCEDGSEVTALPAIGMCTGAGSDGTKARGGAGGSGGDQAGAFGAGGASKGCEGGSADEVICSAYRHAAGRHECLPSRPTFALGRSRASLPGDRVERESVKAARCCAGPAAVILFHDRFR